MAEQTKSPEQENNEQVEKLTNSIASKIAGELAALNKAKEVESEKKAQVFGATDVKMVDRKIKLFTTKAGKSIEMEKSKVDLLANWFKCFVNKDTKGALNYHAKLEPLNETTAADGGNLLIPALLYGTIVDLLEDAAIFRPRATVINMDGMSTNQLNIPTVSSKPIASWGAEQGVKSTSSMQFGSVSLTPYKLAAIVPITTELVQDAAFEVVRLVSQALAESVAKAEDRAFATGNGTGRPTGIDNYTFGGFDAGGSLSFDEINRLYWLLPQAYRSQGTWLMNGRTIAAVSGMVDTTGRPIFTESMLQPGVPLLKGRPVAEQNDLPSSSIFFGDMSTYFIAHKGNLQLAVADQATIAGVNLWERNMIAVRAEERVDGECTTTRAFVEMTNTGVS